MHYPTQHAENCYAPILLDALIRIFRVFRTTSSQLLCSPARNFHRGDAQTRRLKCNELDGLMVRVFAVRFLELRLCCAVYFVVMKCR
jgi:hypothetical protein